MSLDYRLEVRKDQPILLGISYKSSEGREVDLTGSAAFFCYSKTSKPYPGEIDSGVIRFNIPTGKKRGPLADRYEIKLKNLRTGETETLMSGPLIVENE